MNQGQPHPRPAHSPSTLWASYPVGQEELTKGRLPVTCQCPLLWVKWVDCSDCAWRSGLGSAPCRKAEAAPEPSLPGSCPYSLPDWGPGSGGEGWADRCNPLVEGVSAPGNPQEMGDKRITAFLWGSRQVVIQAHQEQLDEMAELSFKEEVLRSCMAPHVSGFGQAPGL